MLRTRQRNQCREGADRLHVAAMIIGIGGGETGRSIARHGGIRSSRWLHRLTIHHLRKRTTRLHRHNKALRRTHLRKHRHRQPDQGHQNDELTKAAQGLHERRILSCRLKFHGRERARRRHCGNAANRFEK